MKRVNMYERLRMVRDAWDELADNVSFGGLNLANFSAKVATIETALDEIEDLERRLRAARHRRNVLLREAREPLSLVVNSVRGRPGLGEDSPLYRAMGYVPRSERASGLTRRDSEGSASVPAQAA